MAVITSGKLVRRLSGHMGTGHGASGSCCRRSTFWFRLCFTHFNQESHRRTDVGMLCPSLLPLPFCKFLWDKLALLRVVKELCKETWHKNTWLFSEPLLCYRITNYLKMQWLKTMRICNYSRLARGWLIWVGLISGSANQLSSSGLGLAVAAELSSGLSIF